MVLTVNIIFSTLHAYVHTRFLATVSPTLLTWNLPLSMPISSHTVYEHSRITGASETNKKFLGRERTIATCTYFVLIIFMQVMQLFMLIQPKSEQKYNYSLRKLNEKLSLE